MPPRPPTPHPPPPSLPPSGSGAEPRRGAGPPAVVDAPPNPHPPPSRRPAPAPAPRPGRPSRGGPRADDHPPSASAGPSLGRARRRGGPCRDWGEGARDRGRLGEGARGAGQRIGGRCRRRRRGWPGALLNAPRRRPSQRAGEGGRRGCSLEDEVLWKEGYRSYPRARELRGGRGGAGIPYRAPLVLHAVRVREAR